MPAVAGILVFQGIFVLIFAAVLGIFLVRGIRGLIQWHKNNQSPKMTKQATVAAKRTVVNRIRSGNIKADTLITTYYVTFQVEQGERIEFLVRGEEYGRLEKGNQGMLSFQGTRYLGFQRS